jgi:hypothetical protein
MWPTLNSVDSPGLTLLATAGLAAMRARTLPTLEAYQRGQWDEARQLAEDTANVCGSRDYQLHGQQAQAVRAFVAACRRKSSLPRPSLTR